MKLVKKIASLFIFSSVLGVDLMAQGPPPPPPPPPAAGGGPACWPPPCIPIEGELYVLIIAGVLLVLLSLNKKRTA
jgi:hypothetical protein